jgi:hypothetical protein
MNFGIVKDHGHAYKFDLNHYFVGRSFLHMAMVRPFEVVLG